MSHWQVKSTAEEVALAARDLIIEAAQHAIQTRGIFKIVLAGGTTPIHIYELLAKASCQWEKWSVYLGDERCLPLGDSDRNSTMIQQTLFDKIGFPDDNIHFIPAEWGAKKAAAAYRPVVHTALPFDLVLLGMGEDGHTASLFPQQQHKITEEVHAIANAPKPPSERVSMSAASLSQTQILLRIVTGVNKAESVNLWRSGQSLPIATITCIKDDIILLDQLADNN